MKPRLPDEIRLQLPMEIVHHIQSFVPPMEKEPRKTVSLTLHKDLIKIQRSYLKGKSSTYMRGFEDFFID